MKKAKKVIEMLVNDEDNNGVDTIALVNMPAIEIDFLKFGKESNITLAKADIEKHIITGPAMIPDKEIYRYNQETNEEFYVWFSKATVESVAQQYMITGKQVSVNLEHEIPLSDISLVESWIVRNPDNDAANELGYKVPVGTWMISMKVNNPTVWESMVKTNAVKGFSIEGYFIEKYSADIHQPIDEYF